MHLVARNALIALALTIVIIGTVAFAVNYLDRMRLSGLAAIENQIAIDTLSLETQFSLLESAPCETATSTVLVHELADLGERLSYAEERFGTDHPEVVQLKKRYTLLEIKEYLATKELARVCGLHPVTVLYFYSNQGNCEDCDRAGYALSYLHDTYPDLRIYSFDYNLDLGALETLIGIQKLREELPAFVINDKTSYGYSSLTELMDRFPRGVLSTTTPK